MNPGPHSDVHALCGMFVNPDACPVNSPLNSMTRATTATIATIAPSIIP